MVTYQYYIDQYHGGAISSAEWPAAEREAAATIERYKRIYKVTAPAPNAWENAVCAVAEVLVSHAKADNIQLSGGVVSSASIGSVSVAYRATTEAERASATKHRQAEVFRAAKLYLRIYRGVRMC